MPDTIKEPALTKIKKSHICQGCGKQLKVNDICYHSTYAGNGEIWHFYECEECRQYCEQKCSKCNDFYYCIGEDYSIGAISDCKQQTTEGEVQ